VIGKIEKGTDGAIAWEVSRPPAPGFSDGQERTDFVREATFDRMVRWRDVYEKTETAGVADVDGRPCFKVTLTPPGARPQTYYFDRETGLISKVEILVASPMGSVPTESFFSDYRRVDGVLLPFKMKVKVAGQERAVTIRKSATTSRCPRTVSPFPPGSRAAGEEAEVAAAGEPRWRPLPDRVCWGRLRLLPDPVDPESTGRHLNRREARDAPPRGRDGSFWECRR